MPEQSSEITVYWRPGCGFCSSLLRHLDRSEVPHRRVNIRDDPKAAAVVRSVADGNETVPTVTVGPVSLVNPRLTQILEVATVHAPTAVPNGWEPPQPGRFGRWIRSRLAGGSAPA